MLKSFIDNLQPLLNSNNNNNYYYFEYQNANNCSTQSRTCSSRWAVALVSVDQVNAASPVLTGVTVALLNLDVADGAGVSRVALAGEGGDAVLAHAVVARLRFAVVDVLLTEWTGET